MTFSQPAQLPRAVAIKQRRARVQAKAGHTDMKLKHPDWCRDAQLPTPNYTHLNKLVKEDTEKKQERQQTFTRKLHQDG